MHKDLSQNAREAIEVKARMRVLLLMKSGESLALAREAWIAEFDRMAAEMDGGDG